MKMYSAEVGTVYGYVAQASTDFKYKIFENKQDGRYCKTGIAILDAPTSTATCASISNVKTNLDSYVAEQTSPFKCKLPTTAEIKDGTYLEACKYYYKDGAKETLINTGYCECSMMPTRKPGTPQEPMTKVVPETIIEGEGYCPFPS